MRQQLVGSGIEIRCGLHIGQIEVRDEGHAGPGAILVSQTVRDVLLGSNHEFGNAGEHLLKGIDGTWCLHRLVSAGP